MTGSDDDGSDGDGSMDAGMDTRLRVLLTVALLSIIIVGGGAPGPARGAVGRA